jgi:PAS domain S-box-containing protein
MSAQIVVDVDGRVVSWDAESARLLGYPADEVVGRLLAETVVPARYQDQLNSGLADFRTTGTVRSLGNRLQVDALRKDGAEIPVDLRLTKLSDKPLTLLVLIDHRPVLADEADPYTGTEHRDYAADTEAARAGRAEALAGGVTEVAAEVEAERVQRASGLAAQSEHDVAAAAANVEAERIRLAATLAKQSALGVASAASILEEERIQRAVALALESLRSATATAAGVEEERVHRAETLADRSARGVSSVAAGVEEERIQRATTLAVEAERARQKAENVAAVVAGLATEFVDLRTASGRMETAVREMSGHLTEVLKATEALHAGYGVDESTMKDRSRFPSLLTWWGRMTTEEVPGTGKTRLALLEEGITQRASRMHVSASGVKLFVILTPFLCAAIGAILTFLLTRK